MAVKVILGNKSQETRALGINITSGVDTSTIVMSRGIYQNLRSLTKNKNIKQDWLDGKIPLELQELYDKLSTLGSNDPHPKDLTVVTLDQYLGGLGVINSYPYMKDRISIKPWIAYKDQKETRVVIGTQGSIIDRATGYNVVHKT